MVNLQFLKDFCLVSLIINIIESSKSCAFLLSLFGRPMMVITQKITSMAFEIHDGKTSVFSVGVCVHLLRRRKTTSLKCQM